MDRENVITNIEQQIRWIEEIECHKFPGWLNVTNAMRDSLDLLKDQEDLGTELTNAVELIHKKNERIEKLLKEQEAVVRCKDCKWYDEKISICDNCYLPREQTFFCADGKRK